MAQPRTRTRTGSNQDSGTAEVYLNNSWLYQAQSNCGPKSYEACDDWVDITPPIGDEYHDLDLTKTTVEASRLTGDTLGWYGSQRFEFDRYPFFMKSALAAQFNLPAIDWDRWFTAAIANMNPQAPEADIPLAIAELGDLPRTLRDTGNLLIGKTKNPGKAHLNWQFGWAPLVDDARKLFEFTKTVDKYLEKLIAIKRSKRIKRTLFNGRERWIGSNYGTGVLVSNKYFSWARDYTMKEHVWFTARPSLDIPWSSLNRADVADYAFGLYGGRPELLWEALPWSWLVDYFSNIGTFIKAHGNRIPWSYDWVCVMVRRHAKATPVFWGLPLTAGMQLTDGSGTHDAKHRRCRLRPSPMISFDRFLTPGQYGILSALAISRR